MELKEGMYVRTKYNDFCNMVAIRKIEEIDEEDNKFWIDDYIVDTYGDEQNKLCKEDISKASNNIIDLLEVGDYVNGGQVREIKKDYIRISGGKSLWAYLNNLKDIKSIVTKEQFESMEYKVNE